MSNLEVDVGVVVLCPTKTVLCVRRWLHGYWKEIYYNFVCLEDWVEWSISETSLRRNFERRNWKVVERSHPAKPSGSVTIEGSNPSGAQSV